MAQHRAGRRHLSSIELNQLVTDWRVAGAKSPPAGSAGVLWVHTGGSLVSCWVEPCSALALRVRWNTPIPFGLPDSLRIVLCFLLGLMLESGAVEAPPRVFENVVSGKTVGRNNAQTMV